MNNKEGLYAVITDYTLVVEAVNKEIIKTGECLDKMWENAKPFQESIKVLNDHELTDEIADTFKVLSKSMTAVLHQFNAIQAALFLGEGTTMSDSVES